MLDWRLALQPMDVHKDGRWRGACQFVQVTLWSGWSLQDVVAGLVGPANALSSINPDGALSTLAMQYLAGGSKWVKVRDVRTASGQRHVDKALAEGHLSFFMAGDWDPFYDSRRGGRLVRISSEPGGTSVNFYVLLSESQLVPDALVTMVRACGVIGGGAWAVPLATLPPAWAGRRWKMVPVAPSEVGGPMWSFVAAPEAHRRLSAHPGAGRAERVDEVVVGGVLVAGVWQLQVDPCGPAGADLDVWSTTLIEAGVMPEGCVPAEIVDGDTGILKPT